MKVGDEVSINIKGWSHLYEFWRSRTEPGSIPERLFVDHINPSRGVLGRIRVVDQDDKLVGTFLPEHLEVVEPLSEEPDPQFPDITSTKVLMVTVVSKESEIALLRWSVKNQIWSMSGSPSGTYFFNLDDADQIHKFLSEGH